MYTEVLARCHLNQEEHAAAIRWAEEKQLDIGNLLAVYGILGVRAQMIRYEREAPAPACETIATTTPAAVSPN